MPGLLICGARLRKLLPMPSNCCRAVSILPGRPIARREHKTNAAIKAALNQAGAATKSAIKASALERNAKLRQAQATFAPLSKMLKKRRRAN